MGTGCWGNKNQGKKDTLKTAIAHTEEDVKSTEIYYVKNYNHRNYYWTQEQNFWHLSHLIREL